VLKYVTPEELIVELTDDLSTITWLVSVELEKSTKHFTLEKYVSPVVWNGYDGVYPEVEYLRDCTLDMLNEVKAEVTEEDYKRAEYVIEEIQRVLDVCDALEQGDYETVGQKMYETHHGMSKLYEVSCEELDFLNDIAKECGVTGSRVMGGGFGGCTINLVKEELYDAFVEKAKAEYKTKFGRLPKVYDVVIADGARKLC
jgi:galactokinase